MSTVIIRLEAPESDSEDLMLSLFLDLVTNIEHLEAYTQEMADEDDELLSIGRILA